MENSIEPRLEALNLAERILLLVDGNPLLVTAAQRLHDRLLLPPIEDILAKVPGDTLVARAKKIGVSREAYYLWVRGEQRPRGKAAKRISKLTGYPVKEIEGVR